MLAAGTVEGTRKRIQRQEMEAYVHLGHSRMAGVPLVAQCRRQRLADDGGDIRRPDERAGSRHPLRRRDAEALVGEQHDAHLRRLRASARRVVPMGVQDGLWNPIGKGTGFFDTFWGKPGSVLGHAAEEGQAAIPSIITGPPFHFPQSSLVYFQFVCAGITPILMLGSVLGRVNFKAWIPFVLLWITFVYTVNAFLIWGGGYFAAHGALDYSGGYVIHLAAGI